MTQHSTATETLSTETLAAFEALGRQIGEGWASQVGDTLPDPDYDLSESGDVDAVEALAAVHGIEWSDSADVRRTVWAAVTRGYRAALCPIVLEVEPSTCVPGGHAIDARVELESGTVVDVTLMPPEDESSPRIVDTWGDVDHWIAQPYALPADRSERDALVSRIVDAVEAAVSSHETRYTIQIHEEGYPWTDAPGDARGWSLREAIRVCNGGLHGHDDSPIDRDCVRLVAED